MKSVGTWSYSGSYFPAFELNTSTYSVSLLIQSECGKILSKITLNTDSFYAMHTCKVKLTCSNISTVSEYKCSVQQTVFTDANLEKKERIGYN